MRLHRVSVPLTIALLAAACAGSQQAETMSFFITSTGSGDGANLGGLEGADQHCTQNRRGLRAKRGMHISARWP